MAGLVASPVVATVLEGSLRQSDGGVAYRRGRKLGEILFYSKFHCELNPIESRWCQLKWHTRELCDCTLEGLRRIVPLALAAVGRRSIWGVFNCSVGIIDAYRDGLKCDSGELRDRVYTAHRGME